MQKQKLMQEEPTVNIKKLLKQTAREKIIAINKFEKLQEEYRKEKEKCAEAMDLYINSGEKYLKLEQELEKIQTQNESVITNLKKLNRELKSELLIYTSGAGFTADPEQIEARLRKLKILKTYQTYKEKLQNKDEYSQGEINKIIKIKTYTELLAGLKISRTISFNKEPDFKIWCFSILREMRNYFCDRNGISSMFFTEEFLISVLNMVDFELKENSITYKSKEGELFAYLKNQLAIFFTNRYLYNELTQTKEKKDKEKIFKVSTITKETLNNIKKNLDLICDKLELSILGKEETPKESETEESEEEKGEEESEATEYPPQEVLYQPSTININNEEYIKSEKCLCGNEKRWGAKGCEKCRSKSDKIRKRFGISMEEAWKRVWNEYGKNMEDL